LSNYLKVGDVIMAHDYSPNEEHFQKHINNQIWNWFEIQDSDIIDSCIKNSLISYMEEKFRNVVWVCKIKSQVLLSILVCSLLERNNTFLNKLINSVESQIGDNPVEFLVFSDNAKRSIGAKRNDLLRLSKGKYVSFIDDDDRISDTYIKDILNEIVNWSPDVIVFDAEISFNGSNNKLVKYGREYDYCEKSDAYYRHPNHLMVHKKENITEFFNNINFGEDDEWASRMLPRIVTQSRINKILYFYDYNTSTKKIIK
jgi:glycosyltransferase involved in cell wall biosynthesis